MKFFDPQILLPVFVLFLISNGEASRLVNQFRAQVGSETLALLVFSLEDQLQYTDPNGLSIVATSGELYAHYELKNAATLRSVYEAFEPDEYCPFSTEKKGKCADAEDVFCCVNPFATPDGENGKPTGQYCLISQPQTYHAYQPFFRGFELDITVQVSIPGQSIKVFNLSSMYRSQQLGNSSVTFIRDRLTFSSEDSILVFELPVRSDMDLNSTQWFAMDASFLGDRRLLMKSEDWYERVQQDRLFCAVNYRWIAATNDVDRTDQYLPFREDEDAKYFFDPNYKLATLVPAKYAPNRTAMITAVMYLKHVYHYRDACRALGCNVFSENYHMRIRYDPKPDIVLIVQLTL